MVPLVIILALCGPPPELPEPKRLPGPADAVASAAADLTAVPEADRAFQRYVWLPPWATDRWAGGVSLAINTAVSRSDVPQLPTPATTSKAIVRVDLRRLDPRDTAGLIRRWEAFGTLDPGAEPYFNILVKAEYVETKGPHPGPLPKGEGVRVPAPGAHTGLSNATLLRGMCKSNVPIVRADWFVRLILSNSQGGQYYELAGIVPSTEKGVTDQAAWLAKYGVDEQQQKATRKIRSAAMWKSGVTDMQRRVDELDGAWITHDPDVNNQRVKNSPLANLVLFHDAGREAFLIRPNGLIEFAAFNNAGKLVRTVPDTITSDHTIPGPHNSILEPAISCIRCHGPASGFLPVANDVLTMVTDEISGEPRLDVFADLAAKAGFDETLDELAARYLRGLDVGLERAREDYDEAVLRATGGTLNAAEGASVLGDIFNQYWYRPVDCETACRELGFEPPAEGDGRAAVQANTHEPAAAGRVQVSTPPLPPAVRLFRRLVPPPPATDHESIAFEDPIIGALRKGLSVGRVEWERVYADAAFRALKSVGEPGIEVQNAATGVEITLPGNEQ
jgi:hypothetical protein